MVRLRSLPKIYNYIRCSISQRKWYPDPVLRGGGNFQITIPMNIYPTWAMFPSPTCACTGSALAPVFDCDHFLLFSSSQLSSKVKPLLVVIFIWPPYRRTLSPEKFFLVEEMIGPRSEEKEEGRSLVVIHLILRMAMAFSEVSHDTLYSLKLLNWHNWQENPPFPTHRAAHG